MNKRNELILAVTGASGALYAERFLEIAISKFDKIHLIFSETATKVVRYELAEEPPRDFSLLNYLSATKEPLGNVKTHKNKDLFSTLASGSSTSQRMVIVPSSMGTIGRIAAGLSSCLIERAADVMLKERGNLVLCPRETPLHSIHLKNLLTLEQAGARIVFPSPGFYHRPKTRDDLVNFVVGKLFDALGVEHQLYPAWQSSLTDDQ